jgi:hypothetical protein
MNKTGIKQTAATWTEQQGVTRYMIVLHAHAVADQMP